MLLDNDRFIVSDSYRTELCLLYPPYIIAIAAVYMTCVLHSSISQKLHPIPANRAVATAAGAATASSSSSKKRPASPIPQDLPQSAQTFEGATSSLPAEVTPRDQILNFLAGLNVSLELIAHVCQQLLSLYDLWDTFTDHSENDKSRRTARAESHRDFLRHRRVGGSGVMGGGTGGSVGAGLMGGAGGSSMPGGSNEAIAASVMRDREKELVTEKEVAAIPLRMRRDREIDLANGKARTGLARKNREAE